MGTGGVLSCVLRVFFILYAILIDEQSFALIQELVIVYLGCLKVKTLRWIEK